MHLFTSGRDYQPRNLPGRLPPEATYVRVLVHARDPEHGRRVLEDAGLGRYAEVHEPTSVDRPAAAIAAHLHLAAPVDQYPIFVVYQTRSSFDGVAYAAPRYYAMQLRDGELRTLGRIRVVGMGRPTDPDPVALVIADDAQDDAVPMPATHEGPGDEVPPVEGVLPYPPGKLGDVVGFTDQTLNRDLVALRDRLTVLISDIARCRISEDPREAYDRSSHALFSLAGELTALAGDAQLVEVTLQFDTK